MSRQPLKLAAVGGTGAGKTTENKKFIFGVYSNPLNPNGRKTLIYDTNMEFKDVEPLAVEDIPLFNLQTTIEVRRILPLSPETGEELGMDEKYELLCLIIDTYKFQNGLLYLEDINNYVTTAHTKHLINLMTTNRHKLCDIFLNLQTFGALPPRLWGNINVLRIHKVNDDPFQPKIKAQLSGKTEPIKIANIMVEDKTMIDEFFFATLNFRHMKITGEFTIQEFTNACQKYLALKPKIVKDEMAMNNISKEEAVRRLLVKYMYKYNGNVELKPDKKLK